MTQKEFRRIALALRGATEGAHHGHPDFRVAGRIFATLGYPDRTCGMVSLTPEQQQNWIRNHPNAFVPVTGKWGEQGATTVRLAAVDEETLGEALTVAWRNRADAPAARGAGRTRRAAPVARTRRKKN
jgi:hypothetical protein